MTEAEARALLRDWPGVGGLEGWIARQPWRPAPGGWAVSHELEGWRFRLERIPDGLRVIASPGGGASPAVWTVSA
jgi:hypothetical protein